nr:hypothetical protein [Tanacetum cinerariifolium]
ADGKKVVLSEASIRIDLRFRDEGGIDCFSNEVSFKQLTLIGAKTTAWNEFRSTIASAVICLATDQQFNFSKYIFDSMVKNLDSATKFLMSLRFVQVLLNNQLEEMANHIRIYVQPSYTKKVFSNTRKADGKKVVLSEASIRIDLRFRDEGGIDCFSNEVSSKQLTLIGIDLRFRDEGGIDCFSNEVSSKQLTLIGDEDIFGVNDQDDTSVFDADKDLQGEEVVVEKEVAGKDDSAVEEVNDASIATYVTATTTTNATTLIISMDEITLAKALIKIKTSRPKIEEVNLDWDDIQAKVDADYELAQRLQAEEQEQLTDAEKARLFMEFLKKRRKFFAAKRAREKRNRSPTKAQQRSLMCTYLKNMDERKTRALKNKSFAEI